MGLDSKSVYRDFFLTFQVAGFEKIKRWVLSLGSEAEVVYHKELGKHIIQEQGARWHGPRRRNSIPLSEEERVEPNEAMEWRRKKPKH